MSREEVQFIRLYITTLKREYYLLRSVIDVMHPTSLGVRSFTDATKLALGLAELHQDFEANLRRVQRKNNFPVKLPNTGPSLDELADMFSLSFFKLITTTKDVSAGGKAKYTNGWFSGKPTEWKKTLHNYKDVPKDKKSTLPDLLTDFFTAALKLFPFDNKTWLSNQSNLTKKVWPPEPKDWYMEAEDEEDPNVDPFDWFFDSDDAD